jgi:uncharacterized surface protein with fasciclin (FAS1) repeats
MRDFMKIGIAIALVVTVGVLNGQERAASDILTTLRANSSVGLFANSAPLSAMAEDLSGGGSLTVFALSDQAFAMLPREEWKILMTNRVALHLLLAHYVVPGVVRKDDPAGLIAARTIMGSALRVDVRNEGVYVNGAIPVGDEIECSNGIIYVLDRFDPGFVHEAVARVTNRTIIRQ